MEKIAEQVAVLILMMAVGFLVAKVGIITNGGREMLTKIVLNIASPAMVISSFQISYSAELARNMVFIAVFATVSIAISYFIGAVIWPRNDDARRRVLWQTTIFTNCGFMGYPVLSSLFGNIGVMYGSVYVMIFTVFTWTLGVYVYAGKTGGWKEILLQPGLIAVVIGVVLFLLNVRLPGWAAKTVSGLGSLNTPLAMMIVGALVAEGDFRNVWKDWTVFAASAVRLVLLPGLAFGVFWALHRAGIGMPDVNSQAVVTCVLLTAMPAAANVAIFASMFSVKPQYAAQTVLVSTLLSAVTIPLWMLLL